MLRVNAIPTWTRRLRTISIPIAVFSILTMVVMGPAMGNCSTTLVGAPGDATSGGVWTAWQYQQLDDGPWPDRTPHVNAPAGDKSWQSYLLIAQGIFLPLWVFSQFTSPVCAWNLLIFSGFVATGLTMFGFVLWLTRSQWAAYLAGVAYAFSPYHTVKAGGHPSFLHSELLVALLWACFVLWRRPRPRNVVVTGVLLALLAYTDGYYILIGAVLFGGFGLLSVGHDLVSSSAKRGELAPKVRSYVAAGSVALLLTVPVASVFLLQRDEIDSALNRNVSELESYAGRPPMYLLPSREHPVFSRMFGEYQDRHLRSNYSEENLFLGWTIILLGITSCAIAVRRPNAIQDQLGQELNSRHLVLTLGGVTLLALLFSAPPTIRAFGLAVPGPSSFIFEIVPFWRVYSRFFLLAHSALVPLAALTVTVLYRRGKGARVLSWALLPLVIFELLTFPPREFFSYNQTAPEYRWLAVQRDIGIVAEYPLLFTPANEAFGYKTWQVVHTKPLLNGMSTAGPLQPLRSAAYGLEDKQTVPILRRLGVELVLFHSRLQAGAPSEPPRGFKLVRRFGETMVLRPEGPLAEVAVGPEKGFHEPETLGWNSKHWTRLSTATLRLTDFGQRDDRALVTFHAVTSDRPRRLIVAQGSSRLWEGSVTSTNVQFEAQPGVPIRLTMSPAPGRVKGDDRILGIAISELDVVPAREP